MNEQIHQLSNIAGVWSPPWYPALSFGGGLPIKWLELVADDYTYQYKTVEQKFNPACERPYL